MEDNSGEVKVKEENGSEYFYPTELALAGVKPVVINNNGKKCTDREMLWVHT